MTRLSASLAALSTDLRRHRSLWNLRVAAVIGLLFASAPSLEALTTVTATWNQNAEGDIAGYVLSYGTQTGVYSSSVDVGNITSWQGAFNPGRYYFVVDAYNSSLQFSPYSAEVFIDIGGGASPPTITSLSPTSGPVGIAVTITGANFGGAQGASTVTFSGRVTTPTRWSASSLTAAVPGGATTGNVVVTVGGQASNALTFTVPPRPPVLTNPGDRSDAEGGTVSLQLAAVDPDGHPLTYSATGLPTALTVDGTSGMIAGTLTGTSAGTYPVTVAASDGSLSNSQGFTWTVTHTTGTATPTFIQLNDTYVDGQTTVSVPYPGAQAAGNLNVVVVAWWNETTRQWPKVSDTQGNWYARVASPLARIGFATQSIYYSTNIAAAAANGNVVTVKFNSPLSADIRIAEYQGIDPVNRFDVKVGGQGGGAVSNSRAVVTTNANDLLVGVGLVSTAATGPGAGYTSRPLPNAASIWEDRVVTSAGSYRATAPVAPAGDWIMQLVVFRAAPGASGAVTWAANRASAGNVDVSLPILADTNRAPTLAAPAAKRGVEDAGTLLADPITLGPQIAGTLGDATGHSARSRLIYAANAGVWWLFTMTSAADSRGGANHTVKSYHSSGSNLATATWTAGADSPWASTVSGRCVDCFIGGARTLAVAYLNSNPADVVHVEAAAAYDGVSGATGHIQATLTATSINWESWTYDVEPGGSVGSPARGNDTAFSATARTDSNDWALVPVGTTKVYAFRKSATGTGLDGAAYSATTSTWLSFSAPPLFGPGQSLRKGAGVFGATDGANIWLFVINRDAAGSILYSAYNGMAWTAWTTVPGTGNGRHTRNFIAGYPIVGSNQVGLTWTEDTTNHDVVVTSLRVSPDVTPPTVSVIAPADRSTVFGVVSIAATAADDIDVTGVRFQIDGGSQRQQQVIRPYGMAWDSTAVANGTHTIAAIATDAAGNTSASVVSVEVANPDTVGITPASSTR
jgi:hypothetical protein